MSPTNGHITLKNNHQHILNDSRSFHYAFIECSNGQIIYFFPNGKTGGCFLRKFMNMKLEVWDPYKFDSNEENIKKVFDPIKENYPLIIILRNPIYRTISSYLEMSKPRMETKNITIQLDWYKKFLEKDYFQSFSMFLDMLLENDKYDVHMYTQTDILERFYGINIDNIEECADHIILNENLREECINICEKYNIDYQKELFKVNEGNSTVKEDILNLLDNHTIMEKLLTICDKDFDLYNKFNKD